MKKYIILAFICALSIVSGCGRGEAIYKLDANADSIVINGTDYAISKLTYNKKTYTSEPEQIIKPSDYDKFKVGKKIGKTEDGLDIYEVENDSTRLVMKTLMFPNEFYKLEKDKNK